MSDISVQMLSVAELARFAEPPKVQTSVAEKHEARQALGLKPRSETTVGAGIKVDVDT